MDMKIRPMTRPEQMYCYTQSMQIRGQTGCIGYLRADMDTDGKGFYSTWNGFQDRLKTGPFKMELNDVINTLRFGDTPDAFLKDRKTLMTYCFAHIEARMKNRLDYGIRIDTEDYSYMLRLNPNRGEYNLYCYCYVKTSLDRHLKAAEKGIRFIDSSYNDLFKLPDGGKIRITYPDGERREETCRYIDPYHVEVGYGNINLFHICEFAELMERQRAKVEPLDQFVPQKQKALAR